MTTPADTKADGHAMPGLDSIGLDQDVYTMFCMARRWGRVTSLLGQKRPATLDSVWLLCWHSGYQLGH